MDIIEYIHAIWMLLTDIDPDADKRELLDDMYQMGVEDGPEHCS